MRNAFIVPIEPIDNRYTKQWFDLLPNLIEDRVPAGMYADVYNIAGKSITQGTTPGAFLDFAQTMAYKASQIEKISQKFTLGYVTPGDKFLVTDGWNIVVPAIRYMSELLSIPVEIHSIWHAGAYDPTDILGMKMSKPWPYEFERSCFHASNFNYFATEFHREMFVRNLKVTEYKNKTIVSGQPHNLIVEEFKSRPKKEKKNQVVWPHRNSPDKQPHIAYNLQKQLKASDIDLVITADMKLSKSEYYDLLLESKAVVSCALHENLGISIMEGVLAGCIPIVPYRASYIEMYYPIFQYPSFWSDSQSFDYTLLYERILNDVKGYDDPHLQEMIVKQRNLLSEKYLNADVMIENFFK